MQDPQLPPAADDTHRQLAGVTEETTAGAMTKESLSDRSQTELAITNN